LTDSAEAKRPLRGAAAAQAGFDYQLDVSILAALQLLLISKAAMGPDRVKTRALAENGLVRSEFYRLAGF